MAKTTGKEGLLIGILQVAGGALALYFGRGVFTNPNNNLIALAILSGLFIVVGLHHIVGKDVHTAK